jgi:hypothetical protein
MTDLSCRIEAISLYHKKKKARILHVRASDSTGEAGI